MRFHRDDRGNIKKCDAEERPCKYGGDSGVDNHYDSIREAREAYERSMAGEAIPVPRRPTPVEDPGNPDLALDLYTQARDAKSEKRRIEKTLRTAKTDEALASARWFLMVQEAKAMQFRATALEREAESHLPIREQQNAQADRERHREDEEGRLEAWKAKQNAKNGPYNFHPDITEANEAEPRQVISAISGLSHDEVMERVNHLMAGGMDRTAAYRRVWAEAPIRTDRPLVSIDLEVAASQETSVDKGPYSNIIEVGIQRRMPDGTLDELSFLSGVPEDFAKVHGTGAEDVHRISLEDVAGQPIFVRDRDRQTQVADMLRGSVMVAHNAKYEDGQLKHNLWGYNQMRASGELEVLDTRHMCTYFLPQTEKNSNQDMVEAVGHRYEGEHRALADSKMTLAALLAAKEMAREMV